MTLTKAHIVERLFAGNLFTKGEAAHVIEALFEIIKRSLESGEPLILASRKVVAFKCSGILREKMNAQPDPWQQQPAGGKR